MLVDVFHSFYDFPVVERKWQVIIKIFGKNMWCKVHNFYFSTA